MSIYVKDETANAIILTIDNNGNMAFGDGTPINRLTLDGYGIIDSDGYIVHGLISGSISPVSGSANCGINSTMTFTTIAGRTPTVQLDTIIASSYFIEFSDPSDPGSGSESVTQRNGVAQHIAFCHAGEFVVANQDTGDGYVTDPGSQYYDGNLENAPFNYRWI